MNSMHAAALVAAMSVMTILTRFLPFIVFRKNTPRYITYLGKVLPPAIIGMLVIYCLKDVSMGLQVWKRNSLISILTGTVVYMVMVQMVFG